MENIKQIRSSRTTTEQLEAYLCFLEENSQFKARKNTPDNTKYLEEKWEDFARKLNSLKGPVKNAKEWKASLTHWKYQLKSRARKIREEILLTGGGEPSMNSMSAFEERALNLFGVITIHVDNVVPIMGFKNTSQTGAEGIITVVECGLQGATYPEIDNRSSPSAEPVITEIQRPCKRQYTNTASAITECIKKISRRRLAEERSKKKMEMAERRLAIDKQNADSMSRIAEAMYILAKQFEADKK